MRYFIFISWLVPVVGVAALAYAGAGAPDGEAGTLILTKSDKIEGLIWIIGILVAAMNVLIGVLIKVVWTSHNQNKKDHVRIEKDSTEVNDRQWKQITEVQHDLNHLLGQHDVAFSLKGCAWEPENLKMALRGVLAELASELPSPFTPQADKV